MPEVADPAISYPIPDAARMLGIGRTTLYALIGSGEIPTVAIGRRRVIRRCELIRFMDRLAETQR